MNTQVTLHSSSVSQAFRSKLQPSSGSWTVHSRNIVTRGPEESLQLWGVGAGIEVTHEGSLVFPPQRSYPSPTMDNAPETQTALPGLHTQCSSKAMPQ